MATTHYFQRYSQKENWMTNSTLLLLSRLYYFSPAKFESFINELLVSEKVELEVGFRFEQQLQTRKSARQSVPDAILRQAGIEIIIEAKLNNSFSDDQLIRHIEAFSDDSRTKVLLALGKAKPTSGVVNSIKAKIKNHKKKNLVFVSTTFSEVYGAVQSVLTDFDDEMNRINEDYYDLCATEALIDDTDDRMLVVTAGTSLVENLKYNVYYDPSWRNNNLGFRYFALYANKSICAFGVIEKVVACDLVKGKIKVQDAGILTQQEEKRIKDIIEVTDYYDIEFGHKFYLVEKFVKVDFKKTSAGPLRGKRYYDLSDLNGYKKGMSTLDMATLLNKSTWD
jgi:hypothetical protein